MRRFIKTASKVTVGLLSGAAVTFAVAYAALTVGGYKPVAVYSGSMRPTIPVGGLALDRVIPARDVRVGDVITFSDPYVRGRFVTHRVVEVERLYSRDELLPAEWLHHVVVRAGLQAANALELVAARRQHHDGHLTEIPDALERLPAVQFRHRNVEHHEVWWRSMEGAEACAAILGLLHGEPGPVEQLGDEAPDIGVIVDHEDAGLVHTVLILNASRVPYPSGRE